MRTRQLFSLLDMLHTAFIPWQARPGRQRFFMQSGVIFDFKQRQPGSCAHVGGNGAMHRSECLPEQDPGRSGSLEVRQLLPSHLDGHRPPERAGDPGLSLHSHPLILFPRTHPLQNDTSTQPISKSFVGWSGAGGSGSIGPGHRSYGPHRLALRLWTLQPPAGPLPRLPPKGVETAIPERTSLSIQTL